LREKVFRNWPQSGEPTRTDFLKHEGSAYIVSDPRPISALDKREQIQLRRRYMLVGTTLDSMRVFDIVNAVNSISEKQILLEARGDMAANALFASLFTDKIKTLRLKDLPASLDRSGPDYLNVLRVVDVREALTLAAEHTNLELSDSHADLSYAELMATKLGWSPYLERKD
jgi:hypothetical protein